MRVRNKEIRSQRHRKEQIMKAAQRVLREQYGDKKPNPAAKPTAKSPAKKTAGKSAPRSTKPKE